MSEMNAGEVPIAGIPQWIGRALHVTGGRDPINLQTITIDRIMPRLAPGILALSRRARYLSIYAFLLDEFQVQRRTPTRADLSRFIKEREFELAVAMQLCNNGCGRKPSAIVGQDRAGPAARLLMDALERSGESVKSEMGGYGLYYRTPLLELGLIAPAGTPFGEDREPTLVDLLANDRARGLAARFREAIADTRYYREYFRSLQPVPKDVLQKLAECACLCRLGDFPEEQAAIYAALLDMPSIDGIPPHGPGERSRETEQRRRSIALILKSLAEQPAVATGPDPDGAFRRTIWKGFEATRSQKTAAAETFSQWSALVAIDVMQEALSSVWAEFCRRGLHDQPADGMNPDEVRLFIRRDLSKSTVLDPPGGDVGVRPEMATADLDEALRTCTEGIQLESIRDWVASRNHALAGLAGLLLLRIHLPDPLQTPNGWREIGTQGSSLQPSLLSLVAMINDHVTSDPTVADTMEWLVQNRVLAVHEATAYGKLPEFTFRFRWELGRLRFYDNDPVRFGLTDIRRDAVVRITEDLGLWSRNAGDPALTESGRAFVQEVFG